MLVDLKVGEANRPDAFAALVHALADGDEAVAPIVASALIEMGEPAVEKLLPALERADLQGFALAVLAQLGPKGKAAQAKVQPLTSNADPKIRAIAVVALAAIAGDDPAVVAATAASLGDQHAAVRIAAADALAQLGKAAKSAEPALKQHAADADPAVQAAVARALQSVTQ